MAKILVADIDMKNAKSIKQIIEMRDGNKVEYITDENKNVSDKGLKSPNVHYIFFTSDMAAAMEIYNANSLDMMFFGAKMMDAEPKSWIDRHRKACTKTENAIIPIIILTQEEEAKRARRFIDAGVEDVVHAPIDPPIFLQKFDLWLTQKLNSGSRQLYSLKTNKTIDVAHAYAIEDISEFGATIKFTTPVKVGDFVVLFGEFFGEDNATGEVVARCFAVAPGTTGGESLASFVFVGVDAGTLQHIRKWLRQEYARKKQAEGSR